MNTTHHLGATPTTSGAPAFRLHALGKHRGLIAWAGILSLAVVAIIAGRILHKPARPPDTAFAGIDSIAWPRGSTRAPAGADQNAKSVAPVESLIDGLVRRLDAEPGDAKGWALLAQSYAFLGNLEHAESALARAVELGLDENDLRRRIDAARATQSDAPQTSTVTAPRVRGVIKLADGMALTLPQEARLFVIAKSPDGSPMPVAVLATDASRFPVEFSLGDEHSMVPGVELHEFEELSLSARISLTGAASRQPTDIESSAASIRVADSRFVELVIGPM